MFGARAKGPLNVFIHVPKTAGSTLNAHLAAWGRGQDHVEVYQDRPDALRRKLNRLDWISGHLAMNKMQALVGEDAARSVAYFGLIREPVSQIASHYNWLMEIGHRGGRFFRNHPQGIRDFSDLLRASDNADPAVVIANIKAKPGLFLNLQARFLLGDDLVFRENSGLERLRQYTLITGDPDQVVAQITGTAPQQNRRENVSPYHFDRAVFDSDHVQAFLRQNHGYDMKLYARITATP